MTDSFPAESFWQGDSFRFIKADELERLGIDPSDIPLGTFAARKHPSYLQSRFGGNAYGFGLFEIYDRLSPEDLQLIQSISFDKPQRLRDHYREINEIFKKIGLLIRISRLGKPYYLIPAHLASNTLTHIKSKVDEITKIVSFHRKKYLKEYHNIGLVSHEDDLVIYELALRFKEHRFVILDSLHALGEQNEFLDLVIITKDVSEVLVMEQFSPLSQEKYSKKRLEQYTVYFLWKLYTLLKPEGEVFIIANHYVPRTNRNARVMFKTPQEERNFALFAHIFKTKRKYRPKKDHSIEVNVFDLQKYLSGLYVEQEVINTLLDGKEPENIAADEIEHLPYMDFELADPYLPTEQEKSWSKHLSLFFDKIFLKTLLPPSVKEEWSKRFFCEGYVPNYMIIYLGQKKTSRISKSDLMESVMGSRLAGCTPELLAEYRNSFEYVIDTLRVLRKLKKREYHDFPETYVGRLRQPLENKQRRFNALSDVLRLMNSVPLLEKTKNYLNPDGIGGRRTKMLDNLEALPFFGFNHDDLKEIIYIVLGHTCMGRVLSGKMNERTLKPLSDLARTYDAREAINLLRYCRLMTMAETESSRGVPLTEEQLRELFDLYESTVRIVANRELDWDTLLDQKIGALGGIHNEIVRKILKLINHFEFLDNWAELRLRGRMEKEALADFDPKRVARIENVIMLVEVIEQFEQMYLKWDPLLLPAFYRKFLNMEFHGTGHVFERMDSRLAYILLWITVNVARGEVINFNPVLAEVEASQVNQWVEKVENDAKAINVNRLDTLTLKRFSDQLYRNKTSFIMGTGFLLRVTPQTQALEVDYIDLDEDIERLEALCETLVGARVAEMPLAELRDLEDLFSGLDSFYQSNVRAMDQSRGAHSLPERQKHWLGKAEEISERIRSSLLIALFQPEDTYVNLSLLYRHAPSILNLVLPEFTSLRDPKSSEGCDLPTPITDYILTTAKKFQGLIRHDTNSFQDQALLHRLAQREFGPLTAGTIGINETQMETLEGILESIGQNPPLLDALTKSFMLQEIGRLPALTEKYGDELNKANPAYAGALLLEKEKIAEKYQLQDKGKSYLIFLVKHHCLFHHILRGEWSFSALQEVLNSKDRELFDALFIFSFVMLSSIREDLLVEDLADWLLWVRGLAHEFLAGQTTLEAQLDELFAKKGDLFCALEEYKEKGLPEGATATDYLESCRWEGVERRESIRAGRMVFALERLLRLSGIRYVQFIDIVSLVLELPLRYIYKKRKLSSIGYATFEKEIFEALRIYNALQNLFEAVRHFILDRLSGDKVRVFGYEKVSGYLNYENQLKLLLIGLLGVERLEGNHRPAYISFIGMGETIEKRYEAINDFLNGLSIFTLWESPDQLTHFFKARTGLLLGLDTDHRLLTVGFQDRISMPQKFSYMQSIEDLDQLRNYFHHTLRSLRKYPFNTDDYELELEKGFERRLTEITEMMLNKAKEQMERIDDFRELHGLVTDLLDRSLDIGFSEDQKHRLSDLYELRKDSLKRKKLSEIDTILDSIQDSEELLDYWNSVKWYLQANRPHVGKEFESLVARKFDEALHSAGKSP